MRTVKGPMGQQQVYQHSHYRGPRRRREKEVKNIFDEIMAENFPNLKKEIENKVQEEQMVPNKMNLNRPIPRYIIIKMAKLKREL